MNHTLISAASILEKACNNASTHDEIQRCAEPALVEIGKEFSTRARRGAFPDIDNPEAAYPDAFDTAVSLNEWMMIAELAIIYLVGSPAMQEVGRTPGTVAYVQKPALTLGELKARHRRTVEAARALLNGDEPKPPEQKRSKDQDLELAIRAHIRGHRRRLERLIESLSSARAAGDATGAARARRGINAIISGKAIAVAVGRAAPVKVRECPKILGPMMQRIERAERGQHGA